MLIFIRMHVLLTFLPWMCALCSGKGCGPVFPPQRVSQRCPKPSSRQVTHLRRNVKGRRAGGWVGGYKGGYTPSRDDPSVYTLRALQHCALLHPLPPWLMSLARASSGNNGGRVGMGLLRRALPTPYHSANTPTLAPPFIEGV